MCYFPSEITFLKLSEYVQLVAHGTLKRATSDRQTQPGGLFPFTRMHLPYPQAHLASERRGRATTVSVTKKSLCAHSHTNVANSEQLRLATFSQPTFFSRRTSLPRQRAGKLQLTHLFSQSHTDKQTIVEPALAYRLRLQ